MTNSVINFDNRTFNIKDIEGSGATENYSIEDYSSFKLNSVYEYVSTCDEDYFDWYQMENDDKIERISYELYGTTEYWDILLLINKKDPLFDMPYNFDTLTSIAEAKVEVYNDYFALNYDLPESHIDYMTGKYEETIVTENEKKRILRIVDPTKMQDFIRAGYEKGCFK